MSDSRQGRVFGWRGLAVWALLLLVTSAVVIRFELSRALIRMPTTALRVAPDNAAALAALAEERLDGKTGRIDIQGAQEAARAALRRQPLLPTAWRILGVTSVEPEDAVAYLEFAEKLSRRDSPTQLGLIGYRSAQGDVVATLRHYDTILRVTYSYDPLLFPTLASALSNPIVLHLASRQLLDAPWRRRFFSYLAAGGAPFSRQASLFRAMATQGSVPEADIAALQARNAAFAGEYDVALELYRLVNPTAALQLLRDPGFTGEGGVEPFDWQIEKAGVLTVGIAPDDNGGSRLEMVSVRGDAGPAARQLLYLSPGRYRVSGQIGSIEGIVAAKISLSLSCTDGTPLGAIAAVADRRHRLGGAFEVGARCPTQWIAIGLARTALDERSGGWVTALSLERIGS